MMYQSKTT